jgi:hypothetical protein
LMTLWVVWVDAVLYPQSLSANVEKSFDVSSLKSWVFSQTMY